MLVTIYNGGHCGLITSDKPNKELNKMKQSELTVGQTYYNKYGDDHKCVLLKSLKKGELIKLSLNSDNVFAKGEYNRKDKDFDLSSEYDIGHTVFKKGSFKVLINFTY
tara:strand:- start:27 stop:350 length:324 start_codon:yes stop_codon:yes gene_type:complete